VTDFLTVTGSLIFLLVLWCAAIVVIEEIMGRGE
jgi:hypothetical protein